jgi:hypothetical protein
MRRVRVPFLALAAAACLAGVTAGPAAAAPTPPPVAGCSGFTCWSQVQVSLSGTAAGGGGTNTSVPPPPPPACWYGPPTYTADQMYQILQNYKTGAPGAPPPIYKGWDPAEITQLYKQNAQGLWYTADPNPNSPDGISCIENQLPSTFLWVPAGQTPPQPGISLGDLTQYALSSLTLHQPNVTLNPATASIVKLPTFVKVSDPVGVQHGELFATAAVSTLNGTESVTVAVIEKGVNITLPPGIDATVSTGGCGPNGSKENTNQMDAARAGTTPDCGVLFNQPSTSTAIPVSVTQTWTTTAYQGGFVPGKTGTLLPAGTAGTMQSPPTTVQVPVKEIQSLNGGSGSG